MVFFFFFFVLLCKSDDNVNSTTISGEEIENNDQTIEINEAKNIINETTTQEQKNEKHSPKISQNESTINEKPIYGPKNQVNNTDENQTLKQDLPQAEISQITNQLSQSTTGSSANSTYINNSNGENLTIITEELKESETIPANNTNNEQTQLLNQTNSQNITDSKVNEETKINEEQTNSAETPGENETEATNNSNIQTQDFNLTNSSKITGALTNMNSSSVVSVSKPQEQNKMNEEMKREEEIMRRRMGRHDNDFEEKAANCTWPNTQVGHRNSCVCLSGYFGDDPLTERGCWKCSPECNKQAKCIYPGRCICQNGLVGNGISNCDPPVPKIVSLENPKPDTGGLHSVLVYYSCPFDFSPYYAFCRFNNVRVSALIHNNQSLECIIPDGILEGNVSISFDGNNFTEPLSFRNVENKKNLPRRTAFPKTPNAKKILKKVMKRNRSKTMFYILLAFVALIALFLFVVGPKVEKINSSDEEISLSNTVNVGADKKRKKQFEGTRNRANV